MTDILTRIDAELSAYDDATTAECERLWVEGMASVRDLLDGCEASRTGMWSPPRPGQVPSPLDSVQRGLVTISTAAADSVAASFDPRLSPGLAEFLAERVEERRRDELASSPDGRLGWFERVRMGWTS